jgi:hypothetical protein
MILRIGVSEPVSLSPTQSVCVYTGATVANLFDPGRRSTTGRNLCPFLFETAAGDIQRNLNTDHLNELIVYQRNQYTSTGTFSFPTNIVIAECDGCIALVDGQHRVEAICHLLRLYGPRAMEKTRVPATIVHLQNRDEYDELFVEVNKSMPVRVHTQIDQWKLAGKQIDAHMRTHYSQYLRTSDNPLPPHVNLEKLIEYIHKKNIRWNTQGITPVRFIEEMETLNSWYRVHWKEHIDQKAMKQVRLWSSKCIAKQRDRPLMLGMYRRHEWVDRVLMRLTQPLRFPSYETMAHMPITCTSQRIPVAVRDAVWSKRNSEHMITGECYVCGHVLHRRDMECGHVVAAFEGGAAVLSNLEPICKPCNGDMGIRNLESYRDEVRAGCDMRD